MIRSAFSMIGILLTAAAASGAPCMGLAPTPELGTLPTMLSESQLVTLQKFWSLPAAIPNELGHQAGAPAAQARAESSETPEGTPPNQEPQPARQEPWQPPLTPQEVSMRDALRKLGVRRGRYVRCEWQGGRQVTGTIKSLTDRSFTLKTGVFDENETLFYWQLTAAPRRVRALKQRTAESAEAAAIVGFVGVGVILAVVLITIVGHL
jgi:pyruvate/2-oxoglutarate dehydrogenase complex dihydrolipoamide acyltransferase (E2) component